MKTTAVTWNIRSLKDHEFVRLAGGAAFFFLGRIAGAVTAYLTQVLLARWLGGEELGSYVRAFSWCIILANLSLLGLGNAAMRFVGMGLAEGDWGRIRGFVQRSRQIVLASGLIIGSLAGLVIVLLGRQVPEADRWPFLVAFLCVPVFAFMRLHVAIAHAFSWFPLTVLPSSVLRPVLLFLGLCLAWSSGVVSCAADVLLVHLGVMLFVLAGQMTLLGRRLRGKLASSTPVYESRVWLRTAVPLLLTSMFTLCFPELNVVIAGMFLPGADIAIFNVAFRTALLIAFGLFAVDSVILPQASKLHGQRDTAGLQRVITRATRLKFCSAVIAMVVLAAAGKLVLSIFGGEFVAGYGILLVLAATQVFRAAVGPVAELLSVTGHQDRCLIVFAWGLVLTLLLNFALVPIYGMAGTAATVVLVTVGTNFWLHRLVVKNLGVRPSIFHT